jgi:hypothetical protein
VYFGVCVSRVNAATKINAPASVRLTSGLVDYWPFDAPYVSFVSNTATDIASGAKNATFVSMATSSAPVAGKLGQALYFAGVSSHLNVSNLDSVGGTQTVSFWLKRGRTSSGGFEGVIGCNTTGGWGIGIDGVTINGRLYNGKIGTSAHYTTGTILDTKWHHVVQTRDGATVQFYIDGAFDSSQADTDTYSCTSGTATYTIGDINSGAPLLGTIDDLRVYNRILSTTEITSLYKLGQATIQASKKTTRTDGLIGIWTFDGKDITNGRILDRSGNGRDLYMNNIATSSFYVSGKNGQAGSYSGNSSRKEYAMSSATTWGISTVYSMSAWIKTSASNAASVVALGRQSVLDEPMIYMSPTNAAFYISCGAGCYTGMVGNVTTINNGKWHHIVVTSSAHACASLRIYVDGVLEGNTCSTAGAATAPSDGSNRYLSVGFRSWPYPTGASELFNGLIDNVRLYNKALSAQEVTALYKAESASKVNASQNAQLASGLVGLWSLDGADAIRGSFKDRSGQSRDGYIVGTIASSTFYVPGKIGQSVKFAANDSYISVPNLDTNTLSVFAWIKVSGATDQVIVDVLGSGGFGFYLGGGAGGTLRLTKRGGSEVASTGTVSGGVWHHVGVVYDGANAKFFIDGVPSGAPAYTQTFSSGSTRYGIGGIEAAGFTMNGWLDDVRLYNRTLSQDEITRLYSIGR